MAAAIIGAYLAARTANFIIEASLAPVPALQLRPAPLQTTPVTALDPKLVARLFKVPISTGNPEPPASEDRVWNPIPVRTSLRGTLAGTSVADPPAYSLCEIIDPEASASGIYSIGSDYLGARIYSIEKNRVLLVNRGANEYLIDQAGPPAQPFEPLVKQPAQGQYVIAKSTLNGALNDLPQLATHARIVPNFKNGVANGFKLFSIVPGSLYDKIGIENGDVIRRINGYEMDSPDKALEIYQKLRDASRIEIELERRGEAMRKSYSIE